MITSAQIRGARAMTGMTVDELASASALARDAVEALERHADPGETGAISAVKAALEARGIVFLASGAQEPGGPGLRLREWHGDDGTRPENLNATNDD